MTKYLCILHTDLQRRVKEVGDGSLQEGVHRLLDHWEQRPTEAEVQAAEADAIEQKQAKLREKMHEQ